MRREGGAREEQGARAPIVSHGAALSLSLSAASLDWRAVGVTIT